MSYVALYRQFRPQKFTEVAGQDHISRTLKNALAAGRLNHAYLFCGPRGTGKTSTAKILAKAVNCGQKEEGEPCNRCLNCQTITGGSSMDVLEIDAASNRGIDEIRELREKVKLSPVQGKYKVYIIDEVHMLTTEAFNALLKTLEEPPGHVIFILATTEPHKIPTTILSRCQRFDFHQIAVNVIVQRLEEVAGSNSVEVENEALYLIAKQAQGGLRDALSLLDQCLASGSKKISLGDVTEIIGAVDDEFLLEFHSAIIKEDVGRCLLMLDEILNDGKELRQFLNDLTQFYRNLILMKLGGSVAEIIALSPEIKERFETEAHKLSKEQLMAATRILSQTETEIKWSSQARILLELGIINLADAIKGQAGFTKSTEQRPPVKKLKQKEAEMPKEVEAEMAATLETDLSAGALPLSLQLIQDQWSDFLENLKKVKITVYAFLIEGKPVALEGSTLILEYKPEHRFHKERSEQAETKKTVEQVLESFFKNRLEIKCQLQSEQVNENKIKPEEDEIVKSAIAIFGGELVDIKEDE